jgi:hypothetical protein
MGKNIEDLKRDVDATDDVAAERKKDPKAVRKIDELIDEVEEGTEERKKITLDDVEPTTTAGSNESMGMSQNMSEERNNE